MGSCKNDTARILVRVTVNVKMRVKLTNIQILKIFIAKNVYLVN